MRTATHVPQRHPGLRVVVALMALALLGALAWLFTHDGQTATTAVPDVAGVADSAAGAETQVLPPPFTLRVEEPEAAPGMAANAATKAAAKAAAKGAAKGAAGTAPDPTVSAPPTPDGQDDAAPRRTTPLELTWVPFPDPPGVLPPEMAAIPGGTTWLGTSAEDVEALAQGDKINMTLIAAEVPRHAVEVEGFLIDRHEVTNLQWQVFLDVTGRKPSTTLVEIGWPGGKIPAGQEQFPVGSVNLSEVQQYLDWAGRRLPSEAEWVRAGRGDGVAVYPWGEIWDSRRCQSGLSVPPMPSAVGSHPDGASNAGVLDLAGNLFEWTDSTFEQYPGFAPLEGRRGREKFKLAPEFNSAQRVIKGGGYNSTRELCRLDFRSGFNPRDSDAGLGFRAARSWEPAWDAMQARLREHPVSPTAGSNVPPPAALTLADLMLDAKQFFGHETTDWDAARGVATRHRHVAFVPVFGGVVESWLDPRSGRMRFDDPRSHRLKYELGGETYRSEPIVGLLSTSEPLADPPAPPGLYTVTFRASRPPAGADDEGGTWGRFRLHPWAQHVARPPDLGVISRHQSLSLATAIDPAAGRPTQALVSRSVSGILNPLWLMGLRDEEGRRVRLEFSIGELITTDDGLIARFHLDLEFERAWLDG